MVAPNLQIKISFLLFIDNYFTNTVELYYGNYQLFMQRVTECKEYDLGVTVKKQNGNCCR